MTAYVGLYVERFDDGTIHLVYVKNGMGEVVPIKPNEYITKECLPLIQYLPIKGDYGSEAN
ncbi:MAG TPA: hypothetical protein VK974_05780 [Methylophilaceae bacterium]|nr:hypothetical protein [Methylophilaceae bacterium]